MDQYQVVVGGFCTMGKQQTPPVSFQYADAYTPYGPIKGEEQGFAFFTLRQVASGGFFPMPGGSQGNLCLASPQARLLASLQSSGAGGTFLHQVDLTSIPLSPPVAVQAGETWNFQAWYRDVNPGPTSNFTQAVSVTFHTTTAAISTGLPRLSLTFILLVSKLRTRSETRFLV